MSSQTSGNNLHSGSSPAKEKKTTWKEIALSQKSKIISLEREIANLKMQNEGLQKGWLKPREQIHLDVLNHFYGRIVNIQLKGEAKKTLDKICEDVVVQIKERDI